MAVEILKRIKDCENAAPMNITGRCIREARLAAKLTQQQLSDKLETRAVYVCRGSVSRIESGERIVTDVELCAISEILDVRMEALFPKRD